MPPLPPGWPLAFGAGMVAAFNPCGLAVLPAYIAYLVGSAPAGGAPGGEGTTSWHGLLSGIRVGASMTMGFLSVFLLAGVAVSAVGRLVAVTAPWLAVGVGVVLFGLGVIRLVGRDGFSFEIPGLSRLASRSPRPRFFSFYTFGTGYALASLGCTLPIFLVAVLQTFTLEGFQTGLMAFLWYGLGMGVAVTAVSIAALWAREKTRRFLRTAWPSVSRLGGAISVAAGLYLIHYWLFGTGSLLRL